MARHRIPRDQVIWSFGPDLTWIAFDLAALYLVVAAVLLAPVGVLWLFHRALAEVLPDSRPALETVARAKVESTYGRTTIGDDRLQALRDAERRLRVSLLRLVFRRGRRPF